MAIKLTKLIYARVLPVAFISSLLSLPIVISQMHATEFHDQRLSDLHTPSIVAYLALVCILCFIYASVIAQAYSMLINIPRTWGQSFRYGITKVPTLLASMLLVVIFTSAGLVLFIVPGLYFMLVAVIYYPLNIVDDLSPWVGLKTSLQIMYKNWWRTFFVLIPITIIFMFCQKFIDNLLYPEHFLNLYPVTAKIIALFTVKVIISTLFMPVFCAFTLIQIVDLKLRQTKA